MWTTLNVCARKAIKACPGKDQCALLLREWPCHPFSSTGLSSLCKFVCRSHNTRTPWTGVCITHALRSSQHELDVVEATQFCELDVDVMAPISHIVEIVYWESDLNRSRRHK